MQQQLNKDQLDRLALNVAIKIKNGFDSYQGQKRRKINGQDRPIMIQIRAPEIKGKSIHDLHAGGLYVSGSFYNRVWFARTSFRPILMSLYFEFEIVNDRYTGTINVRYAM